MWNKLIFLVVTGLMIGLTNMASAQEVKPDPAADASSSLKKEVLKASYFDSSSTGTFPYCVSLGCSAFVNLYTESLPCPGIAGKTCIYEIVIDAQVFSSGWSKSGGEEGQFQFLIDGAAPNGGGTLGSYYTWQNGGPSFSFTASHGVHHAVTNTVANQAHSIVVNIGCTDTNSDPSGCYAQTGLASLAVRVFTP